uniref:GNAT family N-acetyltransferase n=2 Tax=unclassified Prevotella TaxID=2638335 RepID=A0AB33JP75_9BACT
MELNEITIRPIGLESLSLLRQVSIDTFVETFGDVNTPEDMGRYLAENLSEEVLRSEIENTESRFFMAFEGDEGVGYLKLNTGDAQTEYREADGLEVERIYVRKPWLGCGVGARLFQLALDTARDERFRYVWLGVWEHNERAKRFYERHGFELCGRHVFRLGSDEQTDLLMRMLL